MAVDLVRLADPGHTALVTHECQEAVVGSGALLPDLAGAAAQVGLVPNVARLAGAARAAGVPVVHCVAHRRPDGLGSSHNARLFGALGAAGTALAPGSAGAALAAGLGPDPGDLVLARYHGVGA